MRLASIDIGTNSTRLLVADVLEGQINVIKTGLVTTRLGQGINSGLLLHEAMIRTVKVVQEFLNETIALGAQGVYAAATSAVRDADNREEFLNLVRNNTGLDIKVLSGEQEAEASYRGVLSGLSLPVQTTVVLDVGGGSTEIIWPSDQSVNYHSVPVGAVRMTEGGYSEEQVGDILRGYYSNLALGNLNQSLVAVGGTATTLAAVSLQLKEYQPELVHGYYLTLSEVERLHKLFLSTDLQGRKKIVGLQPQRADIILAGTSIILSTLKILKLVGLTVSESDILHGLVLELYRAVSKQKMV